MAEEVRVQALSILRRDERCITDEQVADRFEVWLQAQVNDGWDLKTIHYNLSLVNPLAIFTRDVDVPPFADQEEREAFARYVDARPR